MVSPNSCIFLFKCIIFFVSVLQLLYCVSKSWHSIFYLIHSPRKAFYGVFSMCGRLPWDPGPPQPECSHSHGRVMPLGVQKPWDISATIPSLLRKPSRRPWRKDKETTTQFSLHLSATRDLAMLPKTSSLPWHKSHLNPHNGFKVAIKIYVPKHISVWIGSGLVLSTRTWILTHTIKAVCLKMSSVLFSECP